MWLLRHGREVGARLLALAALTIVLVGVGVPRLEAAYLSTPSSLAGVQAQVEMERIVLQRPIPQAQARPQRQGDDMRRGATNSTADAPQSTFETRTYHLAVFTLDVSDAQQIEAQEKDEATPTDLASFSVHGLTRLLCLGTSQLFESYSAPNRHRHALRQSTQTELHHLKEAQREARHRSGKATEADRRRAAGMGGEDDSPEEDGDEAHASDAPLALQPGPSIFLVPLHGREMELARNRSRAGGEPTIMHEDADDDAEEEAGQLHPIYRLLAATRPTAPANRLEFALLTSYQYGAGNLRRKVIAPSELKQCLLKFLKPHQQIHRMRGVERAGATYVAIVGEGPGATTTPIVGDIDFSGKRARLNVDQVHLPPRLTEDSTPSTTTTTQEAWSILHPYSSSSALASVTSSLDPWPTASPVVSLPSEDGASEACQFDQDAPTVFLESDAHMYGTVASQTRGLMAGLCGPIVSAVTGTFDSIVGGFITNAAQEFLPSGVADPLTQQIARQLPPMIARLIIPQIGTTVSAALPPATTEKITPYASHGISYKASHDIVEDLSKNLVINIHRLVDVELPKSLAVMHAHIVPQLLGRAVTLSTAAALTHSLAHSPLHDSFCMMCFNQQKQCEYCHFNQNKIFYALYYAGVYSEYYSNYYWDFFGHLSSEDRLRALEPAQHHAQDRQRYKRIYSDKGEAINRLFRRGEPFANPPNPDAAPPEGAAGEDAAAGADGAGGEDGAAGAEGAEGAGDAAGGDAAAEGGDGASGEGGDAGAAGGDAGDGGDGAGAGADGGAGGGAGAGGAAGAAGAAAGGAGGGGGGGGAGGGGGSKKGGGGLLGKIVKAAKGAATGQLGGLKAKAMGKLSDLKGQAMGKLNGAVGGLKSKLAGKLGGLGDQLGGQLDGLQGKLTDKLEAAQGQATAKIDGAMGKLDGTLDTGDE